MEKTLKELRQEKKITQIEMAVLLGISYQGYRFYESGYYKNMKPELEAKISEILGEQYIYNRN